MVYNEVIPKNNIMNMIARAVNQIQETNIKNHINLELNGVRGFACLIIFLFHCRVMSGSPNLQPALGYLYYLPLHGAYAVDLFFVLSGFFIILPYVKTVNSSGAQISLGRYYLKKFIRIFPPYYLNLLAMFGIVVPAVLGLSYFQSEDGIFMLVSHLTFLQYMHPASSSSLGMNGALWTLSITFQFFLIFPLIKNCFVNGREKVFLLGFIAISVLWKVFCWYDTHLLFPIAMDTVRRFNVDDFTIRFFLSNQLPAQLGHFAIGMFLGSIYVKKPQKNIFLLLIALAGLISTIYSFKIANLAVTPWWHWWRLWLAVGSGCLIYLTAINGPGIFKTFFANKYLGFLGNLSYEIYLWHLLILYLLKKTFIPEYLQGTDLFWAFILVGGSITLFISYCSINLTTKLRNIVKPRAAQKVQPDQVAE